MMYPLFQRASILISRATSITFILSLQGIVTQRTLTSQRARLPSVIKADKASQRVRACKGKKKTESGKWFDSLTWQACQDLKPAQGGLGRDASENHQAVVGDR